ncbi:hypothetical protein L9F63_008634, partial [Diploptera punctata]
DTFQLTKTLLRSQNYLFISTDTDKLSIRQLQAVMKRSYYKYAIFLDYDCTQTRIYLQQCSDELLFNASFHWVVWSREEHKSVPDQLNLNIDSEFTWVHPNNTSGKFVLHDLYKINASRSVNSTLAGEWSLKSGLEYTLTEYVIRRRQNMHLAVFRAGVVVNKIPWENIEEELMKPENRQKDSMATYNYEFYLFLQQMHNFTPELHLTHEFGLVVEEDTNLDGLVLMLKNNEIDFGISSLVMNRRRQLVTDYTSSATWDFRISALFRHPRVTDKLGVLLKPFEPSLWYACAVLWFLMLVALRFISFFESQYFDIIESGAISTQEGAWTWSDAIVIIFGALTQQGSTMDSEWITGRIVFLNTHILALMMNVFYAAFIVSSLLSRPRKTIKKPRHMIDSKLKFGVEDLEYLRGYFKSSNDPLVQELIRKKMSPPTTAFFPREVGLRKMLTELFVFHTETNNIYPIIEKTFPEQAKCDLTEVLVFPVDRGYMPVPWGSLYKERITYSFRKFIEGGLINHQNKRWIHPKPSCSSVEEFQPVANNTVAFAMYLQIGGIFLSLLIFAWEL